MAVKPHSGLKPGEVVAITASPLGPLPMFEMTAEGRILRPGYFQIGENWFFREPGEAKTDLADLPDVLTVDDIRRVTGLGKNKVYELAKTGKLQTVRDTGGRIIVSKSALMAFLEGTK
jgi:excisionase family DNA binding protein